jgi:hypothetical protein
MYNHQAIIHSKLPAFLKHLQGLNLPQLHSTWDYLFPVVCPLASIPDNFQSILRQVGLFPSSDKQVGVTLFSCFR